MNPLDPSFIKNVESWRDEHGSFYVEILNIPKNLADITKAGFRIFMSQFRMIRYKIFYNSKKQAIQISIKFCPNSVEKQILTFIENSDPNNVKAIMEKNNQKTSP